MASLHHRHARACNPGGNAPGTDRFHGTAGAARRVKNSLQEYSARDRFYSVCAGAWVSICCLTTTGAPWLVGWATGVDMFCGLSAEMLATLVSSTLLAVCRKSQ